MKGVITNILPRKVGMQVPVNYYRMTFRLEDRTYAVTDLCERWNNFRFWEHLMKVGNILDNLQWLKGKEKNLDADFEPRLVGHTDSPQRWGLDDPRQMELL
jgi:hypothetical protein